MNLNNNVTQNLWCIYICLHNIKSCQIHFFKRVKMEKMKTIIFNFFNILYMTTVEVLNIHSAQMRVYQIVGVITKVEILLKPNFNSLRIISNMKTGFLIQARYVRIDFAVHG